MSMTHSSSLAFVRSVTVTLFDRCYQRLSGWPIGSAHVYGKYISMHINWRDELDSTDRISVIRHAFLSKFGNLPKVHNSQNHDEASIMITAWLWCSYSISKPFADANPQLHTFKSCIEWKNEESDYWKYWWLIRNILLLKFMLSLPIAKANPEWCAIASILAFANVVCQKGTWWARIGYQQKKGPRTEDVEQLVMMY